MKRNLIAMLIAIMLVALWLQPADAAYVPEQINYQGRITNTGGLPFNGVYDLTFTIYDASVAGNSLWTETHTGVAVANGLFSIILGTTTPITTGTLATDTRWLGITLLPGPEMTPRTKITSVAYAIKSSRSDTANYSSRSDTANYVINNSGGDGIWSLNGSNAYRLNGNVGIGTSAPIAKLQVNAIGGQVAFQVNGVDPEAMLKVNVEGDFVMNPHSGVNKSLRIRSYTADGVPRDHIVVTNEFAHPNIPDLELQPNGGNVGIGTAAPAGVLHAVGDIILGGTGEEYIMHPRTNAGGDYLHITDRDAGGEWKWGQGIVLHSNGNIGIGTQSPAEKLHIEGNLMLDAYSAGERSGIFFREGFGSNAEKQNLSILVRGLGSPISPDGLEYNAHDGHIFTTQFGTERMVIRETGNVGIGTTAPSARLDVVGDIKGQTGSDGVNAIQGTNSGNYSGLAGFNTGIGHGVYGSAPGPGYAGYFSGNLYVSSRVGIGVSNPNSKLQVYGGTDVAASFRNDNPNDVGVWIHNGSNTSLGIQSTNTSAFAMKIGAGDPALPQNPALYCIGYVDVNGYVQAATSLSNINAITGTCSGNYSGVSGINTGSGNGIYGSAPGPGFAGYFNGKLCATGTIGACSDRRYKKNIYSIVSSLDKVSRLRGVTYDWRVDEFPAKNFPTENQIGLIAQEVREVVPEVVSEEKDGYLMVDYARLTAVLVEAVKELKSQNEALTKRIEALEKQPKVLTAAESPR